MGSSGCSNCGSSVQSAMGHVRVAHRGPRSAHVQGGWTEEDVKLDWPSLRIALRMLETRTAQTWKSARFVVSPRPMRCRRVRYPRGYLALLSLALAVTMLTPARSHACRCARDW